MGMYSHAREVALYWDNRGEEDFEEKFLKTELESVSNNTTVSELISLTGMIQYIYRYIDPNSLVAMPDSTPASTPASTTRRPRKTSTEKVRRSLRDQTRKDYAVLNYCGKKKSMSPEQIAKQKETEIMNKKKGDINMEYDKFIISDDLSSIKEVSTGKEAHLADLFKGDKYAIDMFESFMHYKCDKSKYISFACNSLMHMRELKRKSNNRALLKDASGFSFPLQFRFSEDGNNAASLSKNKRLPLSDIRRIVVLLFKNSTKPFEKCLFTTLIQFKIWYKE